MYKDASKELCEKFKEIFFNELEKNFVIVM